MPCTIIFVVDTARPILALSHDALRRLRQYLCPEITAGLGAGSDPLLQSYPPAWHSVSTRPRRNLLFCHLKCSNLREISTPEQDGLKPALVLPNELTVVDQLSDPVIRCPQRSARLPCSIASAFREEVFCSYPALARQVQSSFAVRFRGTLEHLSQILIQPLLIHLYSNNTPKRLLDPLVSSVHQAEHFMNVFRTHVKVSGMRPTATSYHVLSQCSDSGNRSN